MKRAMQCVHMVVLTVFGVFMSIGQADERCELRVLSSEMFVPFREQVLLNCTATCPNKLKWESRLLKNNIQQGPNWISVEVVVDDWETSELYCFQSLEDGGTRTSKVVVMAYALPSNVTIDMEQEMEEGKSHHVTCTVYDAAPVENLQIQLLRANTVLDKSTFKEDKRRGYQTVKANYVITASRMDNLQNFSCLATLVATRNLTVTSSIVTLRTYGPPDVPVLSILPESNIQEGDSFNITCLSDGSPRPDYHWIVPTGAEVTYTPNNITLLVTMAGQTHSGNYTCEVKNEHGTVRASLNVEVTPQTKGLPRRRIGDIISAVFVSILSFFIYHMTKISSSD